MRLLSFNLTTTAVMAFLFLGSVAYADLAIFKNGKRLECTIIKETKKMVEVSIGSGTIRLPKSQLKQLIKNEHTKPQKNVHSTLAKLSPEQAPAPCRELATDFHALIKQRNTALDAKYMINYYDLERLKAADRAKECQQQIATLKPEVVRISDQIATIKIPSTPETKQEVALFNHRLTQKQELEQQQYRLFAHIKTLEIERDTALEQGQQFQQKKLAQVPPLAAHHKSLSAFQIKFNQQQSELSYTDDSPIGIFFREMGHYLLRFKQEITSSSVQSNQLGRSTVVQALINGTKVGTFVFDTGASLMTITESFAGELGMAIEALPSAQMIVADGRVVDVKKGYLRSVAIGQSEIKNVEIFIVPDSPNNKADGLLGMSFLKHFIISINGDTGIIELIKTLDTQRR